MKAYTHIFSINWEGFSPEDYQKACESVQTVIEKEENDQSGLKLNLHQNMNLRRCRHGGNCRFTCTGILGGVYDSQGEYAKALEYYNKALKIREDVLGENHPSTATSYNNIGSVYYAQKEYEKATEYINKTLIIFENILGPNHPNTKTIYGNLAMLYMEMGDIKTSFEYAVKSGLFGSME